MTMRRLEALARYLLLKFASIVLAVSSEELRTEPGMVIHDKSGRTIPYSQLAEHELDLPLPSTDNLKLKDHSEVRWIGKPVKRLDMHEKSTGKAVYTIDRKVEDMLHAAVQHAPRLGLNVGRILNKQQVEGMKGIQSVHVLPDAVGVVA